MKPSITSVTKPITDVRADFPALDQEIHGKPLVYLDNAATTQKPTCVIETIRAYYESENSNVHRGVHTLSQRATDRYEQARETVRRFLNAPSTDEIVFTTGTTEACNLVANGFGQDILKPGDAVLISRMEHHANIVPWQMACQRSGATLNVIPVLGDGALDLDSLDGLLDERTRIVSLVHASNTLGTINPVESIIEEAHSRGIPVFVDGAQSAPHGTVDVQSLGADFFAFSGHKVFGPMGTGVLYGKREWLDRLPPFQGGGSMIKHVTFDRTTYNDVPFKFETGTPNVAGILGLATALDYLESIDLEEMVTYEHELTQLAKSRLEKLPWLRLIGTAENRVPVFSFVLDGVHPYDAGMLLDRMGIATRTGHHCTEPLHTRFGVSGTVRASFALYNTVAELDALVSGLERIHRISAR